MENNKEIKKPIIIKNYGKAYCSICNADIHGIGKINYCPKCGHALNWNDLVKR